MNRPSHRWIPLAVAALSLLTGCGGPGLAGTLNFSPPPGNSAAGVSPNFATTLVGNSYISSAGLSNTGSVPVTIVSETLSGPDAQYFTPTQNNCVANTVLSPPAGCNVNYIFTPTTARSYSATLTFVDSTPGAPHVAPITATGTTTPPDIDCSVSANLCPTVAIQGDPIATGLFHGYADPSVRSDGGSNNVYLTYGWPHTLTDGTHVVDIHLAQAVIGTGGTITSYNYLGPLYQSTVATQTVTNAYASTNDTSTETIDFINFVPSSDIVSGVVTAETWVQAHVSYLVQPQTGIDAQLTPTSVISVSALMLKSPAATTAPTALLGIATAPEAHLGAAGTDPSRNVTQTLSSLSAASKNCVSFAHPALWYSYFGNGVLYLALECVEAAGTADTHQYSHFLYSTTSTGYDASTWTWAYVGEFASRAQAVQLATAEGASYTFFTGLKFAQNYVNGTANILNDRLLTIVSPATLAPAGSVQPIIQYGCRALLSGSLTQIATFLLDAPATYSFLLDANGAPLNSGVVTESDLYTGANEGPASCAYDNNAGLMMNRKYEADPTQGFYTYPVVTGQTPNTFK